jgi:putative nucleotide binding protein
MMQQKPRAREEYAIVLDFLQHGYAEDLRPFHRKEPVVQAIGKTFFTLLELVPTQGIALKPYDEVYIGEGKRDQISYIKGTLPFFRLTQTAKTEINFIIEKLVSASEAKFVEFINKAGPISLRAHMLELLPGVGKRHAEELLKEREKSLFLSFEDIKKRVSSVPEPKKLIIQRIIDELEGKDRYRLFVRA